MLLVQGQIFQKRFFSCPLLAVLDSQGIVVKCTIAIFLRTVDENSAALENILVFSLARHSAQFSFSTV